MEEAANPDCWHGRLHARGSSAFADQKQDSRLDGQVVSHADSAGGVETEWESLRERSVVEVLRLA